MPAAVEERRYSSAELLARERDILAAAETGRNAGLAQVPHSTVETTLSARPKLGTEQAAMISTLLTDGAALSVVVGKAGTGKTFALDAARDGWQRHGVQVIGVALARRAARELEDGAGIPSTSVAALLQDLRDHGPVAVLGHRASVLVVDEAGMVGTRQLHELLTAASEAQAKLVLVGDHHQLPEIDAGGAFRALVQRGHAVELTENRRQREAWERDALDLLREGRPAEALALYQQRDRVVLADDAPMLRAKLTGEWWGARESGEQAVMIALRRDDVADLNARARALMAAAGRLGPDALLVGGREFAVGDEIVCLRNDRRAGVLNGTRGHIAALDLEHRQITLLGGDGATQVLPVSYLDTPTRRGGPALDHGYAITGHKAQGMTADRTFVLGSDALYREWGYVAMSRGRHANHLYLTAPAPLDRDDYAPAEPHRETLPTFTAALGRSHAQALAHDTELAARLEAMPTDELRRLATPPPLSSPARAPQRPDGLDREVARADDALHAIERRLADLRSAGAGSRSSSPQIARAEAERDQARDRLESLRTAREGAAADPSSPPAPGPGPQLTQIELARREALAVRRALASPPPYLDAALGARPDTPTDRRAWERTAADVERYRFRHDVRDSQQALGREPTDLRERAAWRDSRRQLERSRIQLARDPTRTAARERGRELR